MSRFLPDRNTFFDSVYRDRAPWDIGAAQPALLSLIEEHPPAAPVLDVGCGTGDLVLELARRGMEAVGIDLAAAAIAEARKRALALPPDAGRRARFEVGDALRLSRLPMAFASVVDSGFLHVLDSGLRNVFVAELASALPPGGRYYLLAFAVEFPVPNTPLEVSEDELRARFAAPSGWRILALRPAEFLSTFAPVAAVAACVERLGSGTG